MTSFQSKPLKAFRWMAVHGLDIDVVQRKSVKVPCERLDPSGVMVPNRHSFWQIKHPVRPILWLVANISLPVSFISLQPEVADVEEPTRLQDPTDFPNDRPLAHVGWHAGKYTDPPHEVIEVRIGAQAVKRRIYYLSVCGAP